MNFSTPDSQTKEVRFRFVWHLGFQKTGTSSFQELCRINHSYLRDHVARFQRPERTRSLFRASRAFLSQENASTRRTLINKVHKIREKALEWELNTAIVSDEVLPGWTIYDDQGSVFTRLKRLMPVLEQSAPDCDHKFVFYTREFDAWLTSSYWEKVRHGRQSEDLTTWLDRVPFEKCWRVAGDELSSVVKSPVIFRDMYEDEQMGEPLGGYLLHMAGVSKKVIDALEWPERKNERLPDGALHFLLELNRSSLSNRVLGGARRLVVANQRCFSRSSQIYASPENPQKIHDRYADEKFSESLSRYILQSAGMPSKAIEAIEWPSKNRLSSNGSDRFLSELHRANLNENVLKIVHQIVVANQDCFLIAVQDNGPPDSKPDDVVD